MASKRAKKLAAKLKFRAKNPEGLNIVQKNAAKMSKIMTWPEREFQKLLIELGIKYETQKIVGKKIFDFYLPDYNMIVEVDGDYYHANPLLFEEGSFVYVLVGDGIVFAVIDVPGYMNEDEYVWNSDGKGLVRDV